MKIDVHQIFYREDQRQFLDPHFIPFDNTKNERPDWCEMYLMRGYFEQKRHLLSDYSGLVSWKFGQKTSISGRTFINFIENNPGYDVYFINPFPHEMCFFKNVWVQGDECHRGILEFVQTLFDHAGYKINLREFKNYTNDTLFCNYWVANPPFWEKFMNFVAPLYAYMQNDLSEEEKLFIHRRADRIIQANYIPFILERMFSTFIASKPPAVSYLAYTWSNQELLRRSRLSWYMIAPVFMRWAHDYGRDVEFFRQITLGHYLKNGPIRNMFVERSRPKIVIAGYWMVENTFWIGYQLVILFHYFHFLFFRQKFF